MKKPKLLGEFKEFAIKGNVIDMAVGVIIGSAFGKIVTSLVSDMIMPSISVVTGRINIVELAINVGEHEDGELIQIKYGAFLQNVLDFLIIALCVFFMVKAITVFKKNTTKEEPIEEKEEETKEEPEMTKEEILLTEIRDILKERN